MPVTHTCIASLCLPFEGFGLPHTDENFWNKDQGNCLDYSNNPYANMHPDVVNFEFLEQMYGTLPNATSTTQRVTTASTEEGNNNNNNNETYSLPSWVTNTWSAISQEFYYNNNKAKSEIHTGWRLLVENEFAELHEIILGGGYTIQVALLLA